MALGSFSHRDLAGANRFRFTGRVRGRALNPGRYTLRATATLGGLTSRPIQLSFRIEKRR